MGTSLYVTQGIFLLLAARDPLATALFHAIFAKRKVKPYYYADENPPARKNLEFVVKLRNKIEHRFLPPLDIDIFGECQALLNNFERLMCETFGDKYALSASLAFALQFGRSVHPAQQAAIRGASKQHLQSVRKFVERFRSSLSADILGDQNYSFKVFLLPKIGSSRSADDVAVEFIKHDPTKPEEMSRYDRVVALIKPRQVNIVNANGLRAGTVVERVAAQLAGKKFNHHSHRQCWLHFKVRPSKGSGDPSLCNPQFCSYDVVHKDYIYTQAWVDFLVAKLNDPATYLVVMTGGQ